MGKKTTGRYETREEWEEVCSLLKAKGTTNQLIANKVDSTITSVAFYLNTRQGRDAVSSAKRRNDRLSSVK